MHCWYSQQLAGRQLTTAGISTFSRFTTVDNMCCVLCEILGASVSLWLRKWMELDQWDAAGFLLISISTWFLSSQYRVSVREQSYALACLSPSSLLRIGDHFMHQRSRLLPVSCQMWTLCHCSVWPVFNFVCPSSPKFALASHLSLPCHHSYGDCVVCKRARVVLWIFASMCLQLMVRLVIQIDVPGS